MSRTVPSRPLDSVYDNVYTVSRSSFPLRKSAHRASGTNPASNNQYAASGYVQVSGPERVKFFTRPVLPHLIAEPPEVLLAPVVNTSNSHGISDTENTATTRSIGIQTVYRDSEAQTDPYTPDYTIKKTLTDQQETPEVLSLLQLTHERGLPIGQAELELIERNRKKKAFEAALPPMTDEASFLLRKAMMEVQEQREWAYRDSEIDALHEQRIALLQQALQERDKEHEFLAEQRIEALRQKLVHDVENTAERIQQERVAALRKLSKKRHSGLYTSPTCDVKRDIISEYADFGSQVYAPALRSGKSGKQEIRECGIEQRQFQDLQMLQAFEATVPNKMLGSSMQRPPSKLVKTAKDRKQAIAEAHLLKMESIVNKNKEKPDEIGAETSAATLQSRKRLQQHRQQVLMTRPPTPDYTLQHEGCTDATEDAVRLIQRLLRGRAVQNMMFEGKERRAELIQELRASDDAAAAALENAVDENNDPDGTAEHVSRATMRKAEGEVISEMLDFLHKELFRTKELAKMRAFVHDAAEERRRREVEEGGRRQAEDLLREREDEVFHQLERVHAESAQDLIDDLVDEAIQFQADHQALDELHVLTDSIGPMVTQLEIRGNTDDIVVKDLVSSFLLPHVHRENVRLQVAQEEKKFVTAAHSMLTELVDQMKKST